MGPDLNSRVRKIKKAAKGAGLNKLLITDRNDIYYYTGYNPVDDNSFLMVSPDSKPQLYVSPLENMLRSSNIFSVVFLDKLEKLTKNLRSGKVGYDEWTLNSFFFEKLGKQKIKLVPSSKLIKGQRIAKDDYEIEMIKKSIAATKKVFDNVGNISGETETDVANKIESILIENRAGKSFDPIVASGRNSFFIHYRPQKRSVGRGLTIIDCGAKAGLYCSDITRTSLLNPNAKEKSIYESVKEIQGELIDKIEVGGAIKEFTNFYQNLMKKRGYKVYHSFGHGIGLDVHEPLGEKFLENMVLTVEPGAYIKNIGGCRIEDMVLVRKSKMHVLSESITAL